MGGAIIRRSRPRSLRAACFPWAFALGALLLGSCSDGAVLAPTAWSDVTDADPASPVLSGATVDDGPFTDLTVLLFVPSGVLFVESPVLVYGWVFNIGNQMVENAVLHFDAEDESGNLAGSFSPASVAIDPLELSLDVVIPSVWDTSGLPAGVYTLTARLDVDDHDPSNDESSVTVTLEPATEILLDAEGSRDRGVRSVALSWSGTARPDIRILRDGEEIALVPNTGSYVNELGRGGIVALTYQVCEAGGDFCSEEVTAIVGPEAAQWEPGTASGGR